MGEAGAPFCRAFLRDDGELPRVRRQPEDRDRVRIDLGPDMKRANAVVCGDDDRGCAR